jgi:hypothetical protein
MEPVAAVHVFCRRGRARLARKRELERAVRFRLAEVLPP